MFVQALFMDICLGGRVHRSVCVWQWGECTHMCAQMWKEGFPGMRTYGCVCPSMCGEHACLCPLGLPCPQVTEAAACRACYDMFIGLSTLMHFKFPTQGDPSGLQSHLFLALL